MRVIRTEMYFEDEAVRGIDRRRRLRPGRPPREEDNVGASFVWFRSDSPGPHPIQTYKWFTGREIESAQVPQVLDLLLRERDARELPDNPDDQPILNSAVVEYILDQDIILERSPPSAKKFKDLLKQRNGIIWVGALVGYSMDLPPSLMFMSIPGGIILVGSALGVSDAMSSGLNKLIKRMFDDK